MDDKTEIARICHLALAEKGYVVDRQHNTLWVGKGNKVYAFTVEDCAEDSND